jgi:hypothetical protein
LRVLAEAGAADALAQVAMSGSKALSMHWGDQLKSVTLIG